MEALKVACFQICSNDSVEQNSKKILDLLSKVHSSVDFCIFPENSLYINIHDSAETPEISLESDFFTKLKKLCAEKNMVVHLGSLPLYRNDKLYNTSVVAYPDGKLEEAYSKIHMFKAKLGALDINEERNYTAGDKPSMIEVKGWKIGLSICFDLRFSELYSYYAKSGCELIVVPSAFFKKTGKAHWEALLKARAIETQAYVVAPGQVGAHKSIVDGKVRKSYGHSLAFHPWGDLLMDLGEKECVKELSLNKEDIKKIRSTVIMDRKL